MFVMPTWSHAGVSRHVLTYISRWKLDQPMAATSTPSCRLVNSMPRRLASHPPFLVPTRTMMLVHYAPAPSPTPAPGETTLGQASCVLLCVSSNIFCWYWGTNVLTMPSLPSLPLSARAPKSNACPHWQRWSLDALSRLRRHHWLLKLGLNAYFRPIFAILH